MVLIMITDTYIETYSNIEVLFQKIPIKKYVLLYYYKYVF